MVCLLQAFLPAWAAFLTDDAYVLTIIRGGFVAELSEPSSISPPRACPLTSEQAWQRRSPPCTGGNRTTADNPRLCLSPIRFGPKRSGNFRLILVHKRINRFIGSVHFRMETLASILIYLNPGDWTASIDLRCISSRVYSRSIKRLARFCIRRKLLSLQSTALWPQARTSPIHEASRMCGCFSPSTGFATFLLPQRLAAGSQLAPPPPLLLRQHLALLLQTVQALGFLINWDKSEQVPTQCQFFPRGDYKYPPAAGAAQPEEDRHYRGGGRAAPWSTATSCIFSGTIDRAGAPLSRRVPLPPTIRLLFRRWSRPEFLRSGNLLRVPQPAITVTSATSHMGWGGGGGGSLLRLMLMLMGTGPATWYSPLSGTRVSGYRPVTPSPPPPCRSPHCPYPHGLRHSGRLYLQTRRHSLHTPECPSGGAVDLVQAQGCFKFQVSIYFHFQT